MKKPILFLLSIVFVLLISACSGLSTTKVTGKYFLVAMDGDKSNTSLSYEVGDDEDAFEGVIEPIVGAVGVDSNFIIAKQYATLDPKKESERFYYYIVVMAERTERGDKNGVYGPFNENDFLIKKKQLGVPANLDFTIFVK